MMIKTITETYAAYGPATDLSQLITATVITPEDHMGDSEKYLDNEIALHENFYEFTNSRRITAQKFYHQAFGTQRWTVAAYNPVALMGDVENGGLKAIPFVEKQINHSHGMSSESGRGIETETVRALGFFVTAMSINQSLKHRTVTRPHAHHSSKRIGIVRRPAVTSQDIEQTDAAFTQKRGNQLKFGRFIAALTEWENL